VEYEGIPNDQPWYHWAHKKPAQDFYYESALKKPLGLHEAEIFKGKPVK
jgi:hypothetical protein